MTDKTRADQPDQTPEAQRAGAHDAAAVTPEGEFGGLDGLTLPGQDPAATERLIALLTHDLLPVNVIERLWIRDIAVLTTRLDYLRRAQWAVVITIIARIARREPPATQQAMLALVDAARQGQHETLSGDPLWQKLIGEAFSSELELLDRFARLELMVMRERNRVLECRDKRHECQIDEVRAWIADGLLEAPPVRLPPALAGAAV